jgi:beta-lactam-binding protein with PASTA domain
MSWSSPPRHADTSQIGSRLIPRGRFGLLAIVVVVALVIARGREPHVVIPAVNGLTVPAAVARLDRVGLKASYLESNSSSCEIVVQGEDPASGSSFPRDGTVRLLVGCRSGAAR